MFNSKKIIIIVVVVILAFVAYGIMIAGNKKESASGVTKQAVGAAAKTSTSASTPLDIPGKEFVNQLLAIKNIKFNLQLFSDPVFVGLRDWSREILPQESGRPNPFAPLDADVSQAAVSTGFNGDIGNTNSAEGTVDDNAPAAPTTPTKTPVKTTTPRTNTSTR